MLPDIMRRLGDETDPDLIYTQLVFSMLVGFIVSKITFL
jgi:hypothetical protein